MRRTIYISGPISLNGTATPEQIKENERAFFAAAEQLEAAGYFTLNPARAEGREACETWLDYMRVSIIDIAECDGIAVLPNWSTSSGAVVETNLVKALGLPVRTVEEWLVMK